jgi:hypothetical protein
MGVIVPAAVKPSEQQCGGERGAEGGEDRYCRRGGRIVVAVKRGGRRGEVASLSLSHDDTIWGRGGGGTATTVAGGEAVLSSSFFAIDWWEQVPGGEGGRGTTAMTMAGGVVTSSSSTSHRHWCWRQL